MHALHKEDSPTSKASNRCSPRRLRPSACNTQSWHVRFGRYWTIINLRAPRRRRTRRGGPRFTWLSWSRLWPSGCTDHLRHGRTAAPNTVRPDWGSTYNTNNSGGRAADDRSIVTILREYGSALRRRTTRRLCATHVRNASGTGSGSAGGRTIFFCILHNFYQQILCKHEQFPISRTTANGVRVSHR